MGRGGEGAAGRRPPAQARVRAPPHTPAPHPCTPACDAPNHTPTRRTQVKSSIVAACGIYMRDIIDAVPIDKYFEMFKPGGCQRRGLCAPIQQGGGGSPGGGRGRGRRRAAVIMSNLKGVTLCAWVCMWVVVVDGVCLGG